jgi:hypothetical protein
MSWGGKREGAGGRPNFWKAVVAGEPVGPLIEAGDEEEARALAEALLEEEKRTDWQGEVTGIRQKTYAVSLPPDYHDRIEELGEGNFSRGVRRLLDHWQATRDRETLDLRPAIATYLRDLGAGDLTAGITKVTESAIFQQYD